MTGKNNKDDVMKQVLDRIDRLDDKLEKKLDKVEDRLDTMDKTLVKQEENLKEHMRRTDLLEKDMQPVKKHVAMVHGAFKLIGLIGTLIAIAVGIAKLLAGG